MSFTFKSKLKILIVARTVFFIAISSGGVGGGEEREIIYVWKGKVEEHTCILEANEKESLSI